VKKSFYLRGLKGRSWLSHREERNSQSKTLVRELVNFLDRLPS
jgi:hypothetical protein